MAEPRPVDIVYVVGAHKSGGTILGSLVGSAPGVFYAGELYRFPSPIFDPGGLDRGCSCGETLGSCPFWSEVHRAARADPEFLRELRRGQERFEQWRRAPPTLWALVRRNPELTAHSERMFRFAGMFGRQANATTVIDSSFSPLRGWLYRRGVQRVHRVRYLHLVRDGRGFLASELAIAEDPEAPRWVRGSWVVVARWVGYHTLALLFRLRGDEQYLRIRYEDLVLDPDRTLRRIENYLGIDLSDARQRLSLNEGVPMRHVVAGNRVRLAGEVRIRRELARPKELPRSVSVLFWSVAGWLALALGYRPSGGPPPSDSVRAPSGPGA